LAFCPASRLAGRVGPLLGALPRCALPPGSPICRATPRRVQPICFVTRWHVPALPFASLSDPAVWRRLELPCLASRFLVRSCAALGRSPWLRLAPGEYCSTVRGA